MARQFAESGVGHLALAQGHFVHIGQNREHFFVEQGRLGRPVSQRLELRLAQSRFQDKRMMMVQFVSAFDIECRPADGDFAIQARAIAIIAQGIGEGPFGARQARRMAGDLVEVENVSTTLPRVLEKLCHDGIERLRQGRKARNLQVRIVIVDHAGLPDGACVSAPCTRAFRLPRRSASASAFFCGSYVS